MNATELRIGNMVKKYFTEYGYSKICEIDITDFNDILNNVIKVEPIPLTEEWLLKFGFEKRKKLIGLLVFSKSGFDLHFVNGKWEFYVMGSSCILTEIEYVHQLQNLYFALTNEELTIKDHD